MLSLTCHDSVSDRFVCQLHICFVFLFIVCSRVLCSSRSHMLSETWAIAISVTGGWRHQIANLANVWIVGIIWHCLFIIFFISHSLIKRAHMKAVSEAESESGFFFWGGCEPKAKSQRVSEKRPANLICWFESHHTSSYTESGNSSLSSLQSSLKMFREDAHYL